METGGTMLCGVVGGGEDEAGRGEEEDDDDDCGLLCGALSDADGGELSNDAFCAPCGVDVDVDMELLPLPF